jgi:hypothetical protein
MQNSYCVPVEVDGTGGKRDRGGLLLALLIFEQRSLDTRPEAEVLTLWMRFMMIQTGNSDFKRRGHIHGWKCSEGHSRYPIPLPKREG